MNENTEYRYELIAKWLRVLMYVAIVSLANSIISHLPFVPANLTTWVSRGIMVVMVICMFQLAPANDRYKKAGIMRAIMIGCTLINVFLYASPILILSASIMSIIAVYQEYNAHSELTADKDTRLSCRWRDLFYWEFIAALILSFGASAVAVILVMSGIEFGGTSRISGIVTGLLSVFQYVIDVVYLLYLKKMIVYFQNEREVYSKDE